MITAEKVAKHRLTVRRVFRKVQSQKKKHLVEFEVSGTLVSISYIKH